MYGSCTACCLYSVCLLGIVVVQDILGLHIIHLITSILFCENRLCVNPRQKSLNLPHSGRSPVKFPVCKISHKDVIYECISF